MNYLLLIVSFFIFLLKQTNNYQNLYDFKICIILCKIQNNISSIIIKLILEPK